MFRKLLDEGRAGENVGVLCAVRSVMKLSVVRYWRSQVRLLRTKFECEVYVLSKDEGGRHTPFLKVIVHSFTSVPDVTGAVNFLRHRDGDAR